GVGKVTVSGDQATVDVSVLNGDWGIHGAALSLAALQQIVYTATEEPGIRRVFFTQNGGNKVTIDQLVVDKPLAREDVFGYSSRGALGKDNGVSWVGNNVFRIELDDARPWHVSYISNSNIAIEIGGDPRATSDRILVTAPKPGDVANSGAPLRVTGSARVFEANVSWRLLDSAGKEAANGHFNASLGSSAVWGTL